MIIRAAIRIFWGGWVYNVVVVDDEDEMLPGIESEKSLVVGKLSSEDIPRSFFFLFGSSHFNSFKRGGAGRSGAESGAYRRHV